MESRFELKTFIVRYFCDPCSKKGGGEYLPTGIALLTNPPQYPHKCNRCGNVQNFNKRYPETVSEVKDGWE